MEICQEGIPIIQARDNDGSNKDGGSGGEIRRRTGSTWL